MGVKFKGALGGLALLLVMLLGIASYPMVLAWVEGTGVSFAWVLASLLVLGLILFFGALIGMAIGPSRQYHALLPPTALQTPQDIILDFFQKLIDGIWMIFQSIFAAIAYIITAIGGALASAFTILITAPIEFFQDAFQPAVEGLQALGLAAPVAAAVVITAVGLVIILGGWLVIRVGLTVARL